MKYHAIVFCLAMSIAPLAAIRAGEISLSKHHLAVTLPDGWQRVVDKDTGTLIRAQSDSGRLQFILNRSEEPQDSSLLKKAGFQKGVKQSMIQGGFSKIVRSEIIKVAGSDAYLCEATREDKPISMIQVVWFHEGHSVSLVFVSLTKPFKDVADVQAIIDSVKAVKP